MCVYICIYTHTHTYVYKYRLTSSCSMPGRGDGQSHQRRSGITDASTQTGVGYNQSGKWILATFPRRQPCGRESRGFLLAEYDDATRAQQISDFLNHIN